MQAKYCCPTCAEATIGTLLAEMLDSERKAPNLQRLQNILAGILVAFVDSEYLIFKNCLNKAKENILNIDDSDEWIAIASQKLKILKPLRDFTTLRHKTFREEALELLTLATKFKTEDSTSH